jgi:hypothetical protein
MSKQDECVKVVVRIRPMSGEEIRNGNLVSADAFPDKVTPHSYILMHTYIDSTLSLILMHV